MSSTAQQLGALLLALVNGPDSQRRSAIVMLTNVAPVPLAPLAALLHHSTPQARYSAMLVLERASKRIAFPAGAAGISITHDLIAAMLRLPDSGDTFDDNEVRRVAYWLLIKAGTVAVEPILGALAHSENYLLVTALGAIGDRRAVEPLIELTEHGSSHLRRAAAEALGHIGDARAVDALLNLLTDEKQPIAIHDERVCDAAASAIERIGEAQSSAVVKAWRQSQPPDSH